MQDLQPIVLLAHEQSTHPVDDAFAFFRDVLDHPEAHPDDATVIPLHLLEQQGQAFLSRERLRMLMLLREQDGFDSVDALAAALDRNLHRVCRDLQFLEGLGLVATERNGRRKRVRAHRRPIILH